MDVAFIRRSAMQGYRPQHRITRCGKYRRPTDVRQLPAAIVLRRMRREHAGLPRQFVEFASQIVRGPVCGPSRILFERNHLVLNEGFDLCRELRHVLGKKVKLRSRSVIKLSSRNIPGDQQQILTQLPKFRIAIILHRAIQPLTMQLQEYDAELEER